MSAPSTARIDVVIPTIGRGSLRMLLDALEPQRRELGRVVVVDDRRDATSPLVGVDGRADVVRARAAGPAAARNEGWRASSAAWIAFLDDDVVPPRGWSRALAADLERLAPDVGASQGRIRVPLASDRAPTDWERNVAGLERARWATADMAYRRDVLETLDGFDERFPRAYREDADLGLRTVAAGWRIALGDREVLHPVRAADRWASVRLQAGNADDALMRAIHGSGWRAAAGAPAGARPRHLASVAAAMVAIAGLAARRRRLAGAAAIVWLALTVTFGWRRIEPGPRTRYEVVTLLLTSPLVPWAATWHWLSGVVRARRLVPRSTSAPPEA